MLTKRDVILIISSLEDSKRTIEASRKLLDKATRKEFAAEIDLVITKVQKLKKTEG